MLPSITIKPGKNGVVYNDPLVSLIVFLIRYPDLRSKVKHLQLELGSWTGVSKERYFAVQRLDNALKLQRLGEGPIDEESKRSEEAVELILDYIQIEDWKIPVWSPGTSAAPPKHPRDELLRAPESFFVRLLLSLVPRLSHLEAKFPPGNEDEYPWHSPWEPIPYWSFLGYQDKELALPQLKSLRLRNSSLEMLPFLHHVKVLDVVYGSPGLIFLPNQLIQSVRELRLAILQGFDGGLGWEQAGDLQLVVNALPHLTSIEFYYACGREVLAVDGRPKCARMHAGRFRFPVEALGAMAKVRESLEKLVLPTQWTKISGLSNLDLGDMRIMYSQLKRFSNLKHLSVPDWALPNPSVISIYSEDAQLDMLRQIGRNLETLTAATTCKRRCFKDESIHNLFPWLAKVAMPGLFPKLKEIQLLIHGVPPKINEPSLLKALSANGTTLSIRVVPRLRMLPGCPLRIPPETLLQGQELITSVPPQNTSYGGSGSRGVRRKCDHLGVC
ncbi:hypothetical protein M011DRAFT_467145 [Sporormia fimetaria CBS 119925]|uniref:Uncharacterized protein n=1 Tax=Sporormia fimetaria CBS 119925 TaxID=1340428 RepID=A0A6A6VEE6_9PLEO|nr:hypothetical protein M011DRAFT_467145 [Sporormia fimetaria CBS 119925]